MRDARGFTLVELLIVMAISGVLAAISMALYRNARIRGSESSAIAALDAINQAQFAFMQTCGRQYYAPTLPSLATPPPGTDSGFLSPDLTAANQLSKSGYIIQMGGTPLEDGTLACTGIAPVPSYQATADPITPGVTGIRYFGTNTDRAVFEDTATFTGNMPETGNPAHGTEVR